MKVPPSIRSARGMLVRYGVCGTLRRAVGRLIGGGTKQRAHPFDESYGVETSGVIGGGRLAVGHRNDDFITAYAGVAPSRFRAALDMWERSLQGQPINEWRFIDLGCGKGRALLMASERSFREVIGVELNPGLVETAELNIRRWISLGRAVCPVKVHCSDATEFCLPDGPCLVFIYNSFGEPVVRQVTAILGDKVRQGKGSVDVIYQNAEWVTTILQDGAFQELWRERLALTPEDAAADAVSTLEDLTVGLRASSPRPTFDRRNG